MGEHIVKLEIGAQTYDELLSIAEASGQTLEVLLLEAARRMLEEADEVAAISRYLKQKEEGTLEIVSLDQLSEELGLDR